MIGFLVKRMKPLSVRSLLILFSIILIPLVYQNCAPPMNSGEVTTASIGKYDKMYFEVKVDAFAYMSCAAPNMYGIFNFKLSTLTPNSGIRLTSEEYTKAQAYSDDVYIRRVSEDPLNGLARIQLSIRDFKNLDEFDSNAQALDDVSNPYVGYVFDRPVAMKEILMPLKNAQPQGYLNYFPLINQISSGLDGSLPFTPLVTLKKVEGVLTLNSNRDVAANIRENISPDMRTSMLTLSYQDHYSEDYKLLHAGDEINKTYFGLGFFANFTTDGKLLAVQEYNLSEKQDQGTWVCPGMNFTIYRAQDGLPAGTDTVGACPRLTDKEQEYAFGSDTTKINNLAKIRSLLDPTGSFWYINYDKRCIAPKVSNLVCYPILSSGVTVKYPTSSNPNPTCSGSDCPSYFSFCLKSL